MSGIFKFYDKISTFQRRSSFKNLCCPNHKFVLVSARRTKRFEAITMHPLRNRHVFASNHYYGVARWLSVCIVGNLFLGLLVARARAGRCSAVTSLLVGCFRAARNPQAAQRESLLSDTSSLIDPIRAAATPFRPARCTTHKSAAFQLFPTHLYIPHAGPQRRRPQFISQTKITSLRCWQKMWNLSMLEIFNLIFYLSYCANLNTLFKLYQSLISFWFVWAENSNLVQLSPFTNEKARQNNKRNEILCFFN